MTEEEFKKTLNPLVKEVLELRFESSLPNSYSTPQEVLDSLLLTRQRLDRVEGIYLEILGIKGRISRKASEVSAIAEEAWANALVSARSAKTVSNEFMGPRERYADADLATLEHKRAARQAVRVSSLVEDAADVVRTALKGLNDLRQDHLTWLRTLQFNSSLET